MEKTIPYTTETFKAKLKELGREDIEVIGEYINAKTKIKVHCTDLNCNYEWEVEPSSLLSGVGCPRCAAVRNGKRNKKSNEKFLEQFEEKGNKNIILLEEYQTNKIHIKCTCKIHQDAIWYSLPQSLLKGAVGCPICNKKRMGEHNHYDNEEFLRKFKKSGNENVLLLTEYKKFSEKIVCQCKKDETHIWEANPYDLLCGEGCPYCAGKRINKSNCFAKFYPELVQYLEDKEIAYKYGKGSKKRVKIICPNCGSIKEINLCDYGKNGLCCSVCGDNISYPNKFIRNLLDMLKIDFEPEWINEKSPGCYYDVKFEKDGEIFLVEMDGAFHYSEQGYGTLRATQEKDKIKNNYAKNNGWKLIRIEALKSDPEYLFNNIKNSELSTILKLDNFDYMECGKRSEKSLMVAVCEYYNDYFYESKSQIAKKFKLNIETIFNYLNRGYKNGMVKINPKRMNSSKIVSVFKDGNLLKTYISVTVCTQKFQEDFGVEGPNRDLMSKLVLSSTPYHGYTFKYAEILSDIAPDYNAEVDKMFNPTTSKQD